MTEPRIQELPGPWETSPPAPGIWANVPDMVYHSWPLCSSTGLRIMEKSTAAKARHHMLNPDDWTTPPKLFGSAFHCLTFSPSEWGNLFAAEPPFEGNRNDGEYKKEVARMLTENPHLRIVRTDGAYGMPEIAKVVASVREKAGFLLPPEGSDSPMAELTLVWDQDSGHPAVPVRCKARLDYVLSSARAIVDAKTTVDASPEGFGRQAARYGYPLQAAMYMRGAAALGIDATDFIIIAAEKSAPYDVAIYRIPHSWLTRMEELLGYLTHRWAVAEKSGVWPSYTRMIRELSLSDWALKSLDQKLQDILERIG